MEYFITLVIIIIISLVGIFTSVAILLYLFNSKNKVLNFIGGMLISLDFIYIIYSIYITL